MAASTRHAFLSTLLVACSLALPAQNLVVDGDLEGHSATGCAYNNNIPSFNLLFANVHSFGSWSGIDVLQGSCYGGPHTGATALALAWNSLANGDKDAMSLDLAVPLVQGVAYDLHLWAHWLPFGTPQPFEIGVSTSPTAFGTLVHAATPTATFAQYTATFVAPFAATHLTVQPHAGFDTWIAFDTFSLTLSGGTVAANSVYGTACGGLALTGITRPVLGTNWQFGVSGLPAAATLAFLLLDFANPNAPIGAAAPGCTQYAGGLLFAVLPLPLGTPAYSVTLPSTPAFAGLFLYSQAGALVPGANTLGIAASNGLRGLLGTL